MLRRQLASTLLHARRLSSLFKPPELQKSNWKRDVVYLYQFRRSPVLPNLSPFCLKVETFLRAHDIPHEVLGSWWVRSREGRLPFIELNGKQIADSQLILWGLVKHFQIDEGLSVEQQGVARAVDRMIEGSAYYAITYFRSVENAENFINPNVSGLPIPGFVVPWVARKLKQRTLSRLSAEGTSRHSREAIAEILRRDLVALDSVLGDKKFLMGSRPTTPDFTIFGHLGAAYYLPFQQPLTSMLDGDYPRLRLLLERMKIHYWSDWKWEYS